MVQTIKIIHFVSHSNKFGAVVAVANLLEYLRRLPLFCFSTQPRTCTQCIFQSVSCALAQAALTRTLSLFAAVCSLALVCKSANHTCFEFHLIMYSSKQLSNPTMHQPSLLLESCSKSPTS